MPRPAPSPFGRAWAVLPIIGILFPEFGRVSSPVPNAATGLSSSRAGGGVIEHLVAFHAGGSERGRSHMKLCLRDHEVASKGSRS